MGRNRGSPPYDSRPKWLKSVDKHGRDVYLKINVNYYRSIPYMDVNLSKYKTIKIPEEIVKKFHLRDRDADNVPEYAEWFGVVFTNASTGRIIHQDNRFETKILLRYHEKCESKLKELKGSLVVHRSKIINTLGVIYDRKNEETGESDDINNKSWILKKFRNMFLKLFQSRRQKKSELEGEGPSKEKPSEGSGKGVRIRFGSVKMDKNKQRESEETPSEKSDKGVRTRFGSVKMDKEQGQSEETPSEKSDKGVRTRLGMDKKKQRQSEEKPSEKLEGVRIRFGSVKMDRKEQSQPATIPNVTNSSRQSQMENKESNCSKMGNKSPGASIRTLYKNDLYPTESFPDSIVLKYYDQRIIKDNGMDQAFRNRNYALRRSSRWSCIRCVCCEP